MKEIIINRPELQTFRQKLGSWFIALISWSLWLYFLFPLFTLGGWLMGVKEWSDEIRWFGGYKSLLDLLMLYIGIITVIGLAWLVWSFCLSWLHEHRQAKIIATVDDAQLAAAFALEPCALAYAKTQQRVTVHFDENAGIIEIQTSG